MTFDELLAQVVELLQRQGRVSYGALKRRFALDDDYLQDLKDELVDAQRLAADEDGKVLVWVGASLEQESENRGIGESEKEQIAFSDARLSTLDSRRDAGERRQLTVMFCDLVGSTALSAQLDPEEYREVVHAYQETCTEVIRRYDGQVAQHLGDGLLVYFGYPAAHEDDATRAVRAGLEIVTALHRLSPSPSQEEGRGKGSEAGLFPESPHPSPLPQGARGLQVRIGIHTGLVVIGEIGSSEKREILALGETPNLAARLQGLAEPDRLVISAATYRLVTGLFECQDLGPQMLKGISAPLSIYRVVCESAAQSRFEATVQTGLTPLVGRAEELGLLQRRWEQAKAGDGQAVLLSGEPGIGKSRLMQELKEHVSVDGATRIEFRCSPYHQNSALYPIIDHLQRFLQFHREESAQAKLEKLQQTLARYRFPQADTAPLLAALLSLPQPATAPPLSLSPQKQKQKTQEALVAWLMEEAEGRTVYCAWEDLHWADPSTLELLTLLLEQAPTTRLLALLTFRPEFLPSWRPRAHLTQLTLNRLERPQVESMVENLTGGKALPREVILQIVAKTDGVPLFVEELTKMVLESGLLREADGHYELTGPLPPLAIPATLQDSLMARLDRLAAVKEVAQIGATLGREFAYEVLQAVSPVDEPTLQQALAKLVGAEVLYQRGLSPQVRYIFKHALIQDAAYQSLLKSTRQLYHRQIAQVLEERFAETKETQPELLAHHYTEAGLIAQAIPYWQQAGQRAVQRSANVEAIAHLTKGLEFLKTLLDTPERAQQELMLQITLGAPLMATKGFAAPEVGEAYARAQELSRQVGETPQLSSVLSGLWHYYVVRAEVQTARELGEQLLSLAHKVQDPLLFLEAHYELGFILFFQGAFAPARARLEQGLAFYDLQRHCSDALVYGYDSGVTGLSFVAWTLWYLGYPSQAMKRSQEALTLAQELAHPYSLALTLEMSAIFHQCRREVQLVQERADATITLSTEQGFSYWVAWIAILKGWALAEQGQREEGIAQLRHGLAAYRDTGAELWRSYQLTLLAEAYGKKGQASEGLQVLTEALAVADKNEERFYEAEIYRLKGMLTLQSQASLGQVQNESQASQNKSEDTSTQHLIPGIQGEAEACFLKAIEIAQRQQAKSLELRAVMSLAPLWQQQGKKEEAHEMLAEIYHWFTEGFDTKDLQEAKALLQELSD